MTNKLTKVASTSPPPPVPFTTPPPPSPSPSSATSSPNNSESLSMRTSVVNVGRSEPQTPSGLRSAGFFGLAGSSANRPRKMQVRARGTHAVTLPPAAAAEDEPRTRRTVASVNSGDAMPWTCSMKRPRQGASGSAPSPPCGARAISRRLCGCRGRMIPRQLSGR